MRNTTLLTVIGSKTPLKDLGTTIENAREANTHLSFIIAGAVSHFPAYQIGLPPYGSMYVPDGWQEALAAAHKDLETKADELKALLQKESVSGDVKTVGCEPAMLPEIIAERAKFCDVAQIATDLRSDKLVFGNVLHGILFGSPVAAMLNTENMQSPKRIFVAWDTSLPAARAVQRALPLLKDADEVTVSSFDPVMTQSQDGENPGSDVAKWLSHHGCNVTVQQYPSGGVEIGNAILARSAEIGADLVVAGGYSHSKLLQVFFGGTSQLLIDQPDMPVLLAH